MIELKLTDGSELDIASYYDIRVVKSKLAYLRTSSLTYVQSSNEFIRNGVALGRDFIPIKGRAHPEVRVTDPNVSGSLTERMRADHKLAALRQK